MEFGFLKTRVARRFLAVNLLTALAPIAVVAAVSFEYVRAELHNQAQKRVQRLSKSAGMTTLTYLTSLTLKLSQSAESPNTTEWFAQLMRADASAGIPENIPGLPPRALGTEELTQLREGGAILLLAPSDDGHSVVLARAPSPWSVTNRPVVWARVQRDALFAEVEEAILGEDAGFCIFETGTFNKVVCNTNLDARAMRLAAARAQTGGIERDAISDGGYLVSARDVYLKHEYLAAEWRTVVLQSSQDSLAAAASFRNTFLLLIGAVIALIFAFSHAQIRRTTEPLAQLKDGTLRLQSGDFSTPVVVHGDDEYSEVAASFNGMATSLHRQISLMHHLDAVDQSALGARDTQAVIEEALACASESIPAISVTVGLLSADDAQRLRTVSLDVLSGDRRRADVVLDPVERTELLANPRELLLEAAADHRSYRRISTAAWSTLVLPLVSEHELLGLIAVDLRDMPTEPDRVADVRRLADRIALAVSNVQLLTRLDALSAGTVLAFARAIDANSPWTAGHSERVTRVALAIGQELHLTRAELDTLERGGLLHDIGKIAVPPDVLDKAARLTDNEWAVMRRHPVVGCEILSPIPAFADSLPIVRSHHERMDGTGYPDRLYGDEIPYLARVLAVADVFDALTSDRPYRPGLTTAAACEIIQNGSGAHFDPRIVRAFLDALHADRIVNSALGTSAHSLAASVARARGTPQLQS